MNYFNFKNKNVVIIGGSGKFGQHIVEIFKNKNANISVISRKKIFYKSRKIKNYQINLENINSIKKLPNKINKKIDVLINCSINRGGNILEKYKIDFLSENILLNSFQTKMKKNSSIILLSSIYGENRPKLDIYTEKDIIPDAYYVHLKSGYKNLCKYYAKIFEKKKIRVNSIAFGGMKSKKMSQFFYKNYIKLTTAKRMMLKKDLELPILFLSSNFSEYVNGSTLVVDGGFSCR